MRTLCLTLLLCIGMSPLHAEEKKTRVLLVGKDRDHPYRTHEYMSVCKLLAKCLEQSPNVETFVSNGWPKDADKLKDIDAIVLYTANGGNVLLGSTARKQATEMLKNGVGLTAVHWSTGASKDVGEDYMKVLGGWFSRDIGSGLNTTRTTLIQAAPDHPVCHGWKDYQLRDEYYLKLRYAEGTMPVMKVKLDGEEHVVGWVYERPDAKKGRSFGFVCGHFHDNFGEEAFRKAIVNGVLWTAHREVPKGGAKVVIGKKDMELPPDPNKKE